ncbi:MAG TPA: NmrA family NAD(P)-binding protein [Kofleriaceae bacterium]|nr:NmrA family NAD(P)-binding protein [Kofleriaceae bacterium]
MFVIAGATGHVGGVAARELLANKHKVKVIVRDAAKGRDWSARGAELAAGKLDDPSFLAGALKGASGLFTLLPADYAATDVFASQKRIADAIASGVKQSGVPLVVLLSSLGADLASGTGPIKGLHYAENALRATGTKLVSIRAAYFQENLAQAVAPAKQMGTFFNFMPSRDAAMPTIATKDIGALVARTLVSPPARSENVDLVGPTYTVGQLVEKLGAAVGKPLQIVDIPPQGHVEALVQAGVPRPFAVEFAEMYAAFGTGKVTSKGDRVEHGATKVEDVIAELVKA